MDTVFAVDHILELIFNNLSGRDLLNCQLVSCEWFIVARKVLSRRRSSYFYLSDSNILQINPKTVKGDAKIEGEVFWFQWLMKNFPSTQFLKIISDSIESDHVENCISSSDPVFIRKVIADRTMCAPKFALIFGPLSPACVPSGVPTLIIGTNKAIYSTEQRETICDRERSSSLVNVSGFLLSDSCANLKIELISNWFDPSLDVSKTISNLKFPKYVLIRLDQADGITHNPKLQSFLAHLSDVNCKVSLVCSPFCIHRTSSMSDKSFVYGTQPVVIFSGPKMITVQRSFTDMESDFLMEVKMFKSSLNFDPDLNDQSSQTLGFVFGTSLSEFCMERIKQVFPRVVFIGALYNMNRTIVSNYFDDDQRSSYIQPITLKSFSERVKTTLMRGSPPKDGFTITLMNIASNSR